MRYNKLMTSALCRSVSFFDILYVLLLNELFAFKTLSFRPIRS